MLSLLKKFQILLFIGGALVAVGMVISFYGSKLATSDLSVSEGVIESNSSLEITKELDPLVAKKGVYVIQVENPQGGLDAVLYDPAGNQIISQKVSEKSTERSFDIVGKGSYKLVLENKGAQASAVIGITHMPQQQTLAINVLGQSIILAGFVGVVIAIIYVVINKKRSI